MREKLKTVTDFATTAEEENVVGLLKAIKSTVFKFENKCDIYVAMGNIINQFLCFYQARDKSNIAYFEKFKNLVDVAEEHRANLRLHQGLIKEVAANPNAPTQEEKDISNGKFLGQIFIFKACCFRYHKLKEELHNKLAQGWNRYPESVEKAYTILCKRRDNGTLRITTELQLAFYVEGEGGKEEDSGEEIVPPQEEKKEEVLAFLIEGEEDPHADKSDGENKFIFLTTQHRTVNKNMLLLDNKSSTNIMCNQKYVTNIRKVNRMLTLHYFEHSTNTNYMCEVPGYGTSWFHEKGAVNILSLSK
eukprot:8029671-Ditylum_brightwellii.AAC.1